MTRWPSTRREFLGFVGLGNVSWTTTTDTGPDRPRLPTANVEWSVDTGAEDVLLRGATADGMLYVGTPTDVYGFSTDGTQRWRRSIASAGQDSPVEVYPGTGTVYVEGRRGTYALDAVDGHTKWEYGAEQHVDVALVTADTVLLSERGITAVTTSNGRERWRFEPEDPIWIHPHVTAEYVYVGTIRGHLYAVDGTTGRVDWHADRSAGDAPPRFWVAGSNDETVFAWDSEGGQLYSFDRDDGSLRWQFAASEGATAFTGAVRDDVVYLCDGPRVRAITASDGTERWQYSAGSNVVRSPKFAGRTGYFGTLGGVHAVSTTGGTSRWRFSTNANAPAYVASVVDGTAIVDSRGDAIYGLDAESGRPQWRFGYDGRPGWFPTVADDTVYFATGSGTIYALSEPDSTLLDDAYRTVTSPAGIAVGGLFGGVLVAGAYRRYVRDTPDPSERTTLDDFEPRDAVAETDYSTVYEARASSGERVTLERFAGDAIASEAFSAAVETWAGLDVPGVLDVRAWGTDPVPWVATELVDARLSDRVSDLDPAELAHVVADVAETVHRAHREGVVHGRLVPGNVLFVDGEVRVGGWRLAAELRDPPAEYAVPKSNLDSEYRDTYQLAALVDELVADEQRTANLDDVLTRAFAADSADRYDSALAFADMLRWTAREG